VAAAPRSGKDHDLAKAAVVDRVILAVIENYYDPERISPREMFDSVTGMLERKVAEFEFRRHGERAAQVALGGRILDLDLAELDSPWELSRLLRRLLGFLERNLPAGEYDEVDLEYDVANAVLATLDPHSSAMSPDVYEDLRMGTVGEFGGLGIKITTDRRPPCGGVLTVVEVFPHTPAQRAGFKVGDRILRIDGESTINITTGEAANRLRGKPGTGVELELERADGTRRKVGVTRQRIPIESVTWKLLDGGVGYVELEAFQGNSAMEFAGALRALHAKGMKGLILDLRGNPGGLLDMAIKVADQFLDSGTIVATAGRPEDEREVSNASPEGTEPRYPMVVLIDFVSASAAEIIAGALRNHGRALLAGETTFGKGSVQLVMPLPAGGALRLTSAQYLTPGDISIQTVGVAPDVRFLPVVVDKEQLELEWRGRVFSEADLDKHLERPSARGRGDRDGAAEALLFVPAAEREKDRQRFDRCYADDPDRQGWKARYEVEFARRLVAGARGETAEGLLIDARDLVARDRVEEDLKLVRAFGKLGVDWSAPGVASPAADPGSAPEPRVVPEVTVKMALTGKAEPGSKLGIKVTVHNGSDRPIHRLRAVTRSENQVFEGRELAFGLVAPGRSRAWTAIVELPPVMAARIDPVTLDFRSADGRIPGGASIDVRIPGRSEPRLAFAWHLEDLGNGNGFIEPGEEILAHVRVSNLGEGATFDSEANLSARPGVDIIEGRFHIGRLEPGASREGRFRFRVAGRFEGTVAEIRLSIDDWVRSRFPTTLTLLDTTFDIDVSPVKPGPSSAAGHVTLVDGGPDVPLLAAPDPRGATVATARPGTAFPVDGRHRGFFRLLLGEQRHAWVAEERVRAGGEGRGAFQPIPIEPPLIDVEGDSVRITGAATIAVKGRVRHPRSVRDLIVFVGNRKVAYVANPSGGNPAELAFDLVLPLEEGANPIGLVARHDSKVVSTRAMFVRRSSPAAPGSGKSGK
jgi:carboxyl-terminal processing protease